MNDDLTYKMMGENAGRVCIIITDIDESDVDQKMMAADLESINGLINKLGFTDENTLRLERKSSQMISLSISDYFEEYEKNIKNVDYIMSFILSFQKEDGFRTKSVTYTSDEFKGNFVANILLKWAEKPKLIFLQAPLLQKLTEAANATTNAVKDFTKQNNDFNLPIVANIMEAFACIRGQNSYGNEAGSFYIQALCHVFNQHIENGSFYTTYLSVLMYEVHAKVREFLVGEINAANPNVIHRDQTPYVKSTFVKNFLFPK